MRTCKLLLRGSDAETDTWLLQFRTLGVFSTSDGVQVDIYVTAPHTLCRWDSPPPGAEGTKLAHVGPRPLASEEKNGRVGAARSWGDLLGFVVENRISPRLSIHPLLS